MCGRAQTLATHQIFLNWGFPKWLRIRQRFPVNVKVSCARTRSLCLVVRPCTLPMSHGLVGAMETGRKSEREKSQLREEKTKWEGIRIDADGRASSE